MKRFEHGGNVYKDEKTYIDYSANINPLGYSQSVYKAIEEAIPSIIHYPDPQGRLLKKELAAHYGIETDSVILGNGAAELLYLFFYWMRPERVIIPVPSFSEYERSALAAGCQLSYYTLSEESGFTINWQDLARKGADADCIVLGNPNNPTTHLYTAKVLEPFLESCKASQTAVIVDESFLDFCSQYETYTVQNMAAHMSNVLVIHSLTKFYAIPGLRLGFGVAHPDVVRAMEEKTDVWHVNTLAQVAGIAGLRDIAYQERTRQYVATEGERLCRELQRIPYVSNIRRTVNFIFFSLENAGMTATDFYYKMKEKGILVRDCSNYPGLSPFYVRIAVGSKKNNVNLVNIMKNII